MVKHRGSFINWLVILCFLLLLFQSPLSRLELPFGLSSFFGLFDELLTVAFFIVLLIRAGSRGVPRRYLVDALFFSGFLFVGFLGTAMNNLQPASAVIEDVIACSKFFVVLYGASALFRDEHAGDILKSLGKICRILIIIFFFLVAIDEVLPGLIFPGSRSTSGLHAVQLFYYHPSVLSQVSAMLLAVVTIESSRCSNVYRVLALLIMCSTITSKAIGFAFLYLFLCGFGRIKSNVGRIALVCCALLCVLFVSSDAIASYYGNEQSARHTLLSDSLQIAGDNMPIGLGFGTFASAAAASHYSPVYLELGYLAHYGLGYINTNYLTDTFWPVLLGEFGYLGTALFTGIIVLILRRSIFLLNSQRDIGIAALSIVGYLLICSAGATAFFNPMAVANALVLALCFAARKTSIVILGKRCKSVSTTSTDYYLRRSVH